MSGNNLLTLCLNTAEGRVQFLLIEGELLCAQDWLARRGAAELLAPALAEACARLGRKAADIRRIACVAGPGSFTGLRLGLATAAGLARATNAKQVGLDYLQCLAASVLLQAGESVLVAVQARQGMYYQGLYVSDGFLPHRVGQIQLIEPSGPDITNAANATNAASPNFIIGSAVTQAPVVFGARYPGSRVLPGLNQPNLQALLCLCAAIELGGQTSDIEPIYLRECDAVENLDAIALAKGLDPARERARLNELLVDKQFTASGDF